MRASTFLFFSIALSLASCSNRNDSHKNLKETKGIQRHILFQAGKLGHKPWDPKASFSVQINFNSAVFTKLVYIDSKYNIKPGIFKDWQWENKTNSYLFTLDTSHNFGENRKIHPKDIEFAFLKSFLSDFGEYKRNYFFDIVGTSKIRPNQEYKTGMCEGIKIVGNNQLRVYLNKSNPDFIYTLQDAIPIVAPIEDFSEKDYFKFKRIPRGTGPYRVKWSSKESSKVLLEHKCIDSQISQTASYPLTIMFTNENDPKNNLPDLAADAGSSGLKEDLRYSTQYGKVPYGVSVISFNYRNPLGSNKLFREAVSLAIDRKKIYNDNKQIKATHEIIPSMYLGRSGTQFEFNPEKSRKIIKENFKNQFSKKNPLIAIYHGKPGKPSKKHILKLQKQLADVGIFVDFQGKEWVRFNGDKSIVFREVGKGATFTDPVSSFSPYISNNDNTKDEYTETKDKKSEKLFKLAKETSDRLKKAVFLKELTIHFQKEYRVLPIGEIRNVFVFKSEEIQEIGLQEISSSIDFSKIKMRR